MQSGRRSNLNLCDRDCFASACGGRSRNDTSEVSFPNWHSRITVSIWWLDLGVMVLSVIVLTALAVFGFRKVLE